MSKVWYIAFLIAIVGIIAIYWAYGLASLIFLPIFLLIFLGTFWFTDIGDRLQADSIPGLKDLKEPDFFFSRIYMAWLYVNDKKRWAEYTAVFSYLVAFLAGSLFWILTVASSGMDFNALFMGWILGVFITSLVAVKIATSKRWTNS